MSNLVSTHFIDLEHDIILPSNAWVVFFFFLTVMIEILLIIGLEKSLIKYTKTEENYYRNSLWYIVYGPYKK